MIVLQNRNRWCSLKPRLNIVRKIMIVREPAGGTRNQRRRVCGIWFWKQNQQLVREGKLANRSLGFKLLNTQMYVYSRPVTQELLFKMFGYKLK